jgi:hypothetical protein
VRAADGKILLALGELRQPTLADLAVYIRSLPPRPNRWRLPGGELTPAQERGKALFERAWTSSASRFRRPTAAPIATADPKGTNQKIFDVGTRKPTDNSRAF